MKQTRERRQQKQQFGYGLIEVLVAIAILAGIAILISQIIPQGQKTIFKTTERAECQTRLQNILGSIKKYDNQLKADSWLPGTARNDKLDPSLSAMPWSNTRITKNLLTTAADTATTAYTLDASGGVLLLPGSQVEPKDFVKRVPGPNPNNVDHMDPTAYKPVELELIRNNHIWQLSQNAAALLYPFCGTTTTVTQDNSFLATQVGTPTLPGEKVEIQVQKIDLRTGAISNDCTGWLPIPNNANPGSGNAAVKPELSINQQFGLKVTTRVSYHSTSDGNPADELIGCEGNTTLSPGTDLIPPKFKIEFANTGESNFYQTGGGTPPAPINSGIACDPGAVTYKIGPSCDPLNANHCEDAIAYMCRLDYVGDVGDMRSGPSAPQQRFPFQSTGWFICSLPPTNFAPRPASAPGTYVNLTANSVIDASGPTVNSLNLRLGGNLLEGQYRLHVMATDRARNITIQVKDFQVDRMAPAIDLIPPGAIRPMGQSDGSGHIGNASFSSNANMWTKMKTAFAATPGGNLFQCVAMQPNWTLSPRQNGLDDLNIAPNSASGMAYGPDVPLLNPSCNSSASAPNINTSGHYQVAAIACDVCGHSGGVTRRYWWADLLPAPVPDSIPVANMNNTVNGAPSPQTYRATLKSPVANLPLGNTCEVYTGSTPDWSASLVDAGGNSRCTQTKWRDPGSFNNSCTSPTDALNDICYITYDGCGRGTAKDFNMNYQVLGAGSAASNPSRDCCDSRGTSPACAPGFSCSNQGLTGNAPRCGIATGPGAELIWGPRPSYLSGFSCPVGDATCACWQDTADCNNNMSAPNCLGSPTATCNAPYSYSASCPANFTQSVVATNRNLYTSPAAVTQNDNDPCTVPATCTWSGGGPFPQPTPYVLGTATGRVDNNFASCSLPPSGPLATGSSSCSSSRCPTLRNACSVPAVVIPPACTGAGEVLGCTPGAGWTSCDPVTTCGVPACSGNPSDYSWSAPPFDPTLLAQCTPVPPTCSGNQGIASEDIVVTRTGAVQCMNGASVAIDACCPGSRPADTQVCQKQTCANKCCYVLFPILKPIGNSGEPRNQGMCIWPGPHRKQAPGLHTYQGGGDNAHGELTINCVNPVADCRYGNSGNFDLVDMQCRSGDRP